MHAYSYFYPDSHTNIHLSPLYQRAFLAELIKLEDTLTQIFEKSNQIPQKIR